MRLTGGGTVHIRAPEQGEEWAADLSLIAAEGGRPSAAVYLSKSECRRLGNWLLAVADPDLGILDGLDLPPELYGLQNAYWEGLRDWQATEDSFRRVFGIMLADRSEGPVERT